MIMTGENISAADEKLKKITAENLYKALRKPDSEREAKIRQLRIVYNINKNSYLRQEKSLPYFVCGSYNPPYRKKNNFAYTELFVLDIDNISAKQLDIDKIRAKIEKDERVMMCFATANNDGLRVMFHLKEKCHDAGLFSLFYKQFAYNFAMQYSITQIIDNKTSDVTKPCFISADPKAYFNPKAAIVDLKALVDEENPQQTMQVKAEMQKIEKEQKVRGKAKETAHDPDPDKEIMARIKAKLNPRGKFRQETAPAFVPAELEEIMSGLCNYINETGLEVYEIINIQYGKKIRVKMGIKKSETNLFFGKRGFTAVKSPRAGTNAELNDLVAELIKTYVGSL